jgi:hypothetical protein
MSAAPLALLALLALPIDRVGAQTAPLRAESQDGRFADMDANRDGIIQRNEWRGSLQSFRVHDWNNDGMLSGDELRVGRWRNGSWEEIDYNSETSGRFYGWTAQSFSALDHNRDGRIARNEWHYDNEAFRRVDRNRDNALSREEFLGNAEWDDDRDERFEDLDLNNDGRVDRTEWHGSRTAFDWLDANRNGYLSRAETVGNTPNSANNAPARTAQFASLDYDRNGVVSRDEWHWSRRSFDERDANRDGNLSRREFNMRADAAVASGPAEVRVDARERWVDTGIDVRAGEIITLNAQGSIQMTDNPNDAATPAGSLTNRKAPNAPFRELSAGGLLMRIGNANAIFVGNRGRITAPATGRIYLGVNDDHLLDNSGEFRVTLDVLGR